MLKGVLSKKKDVQLDTWLNFLENELKFPFEATIQESENFELQWKDVVKLKKIEVFVDMNGLLLGIRKRKTKIYFSIV